MSRSDKIRLDLLLVQRGLVESREKAKRMIMAGLVEVNDHIFDKPGRLIPVSSKVLLKEPSLPYVSRGGLKLEAALDHFSMEVKGKVFLDIGASTGGFTDCLLQRGADKVIAVDVGYGLLHWKIRQDPRVVVLDKTNIRYLGPEQIKGPVNGAVIDVSFISLKLVISPVSRLLLDDAIIVALIKPQFEMEKGQVGKGGVVRDPSLREEVVANLSQFFTEAGWNVKGHIPSPILGPKGNQEFLIYLKR
jgi:23S rRNA (cytidine1920-2'-O)/16S rRNA (cytidine1409-2'-O)-methyltransferase